MADGAHRPVSYRVEKRGVVAVHFSRGLPEWAEPQERPRTWRGMRSVSLTELRTHIHTMQSITLHLGFDVHKNSIPITATSEGGTAGPDHSKSKAQTAGPSARGPAALTARNARQP